MGKTRSRPILFFIVIVMSSGLAFGVCALVRSLDPFEARPFDSEAWAAADNEGLLRWPATSSGTCLLERPR
jgi:hypothetical protein